MIRWKGKGKREYMQSILIMEDDTGGKREQRAARSASVLACGELTLDTAAIPPKKACVRIAVVYAFKRNPMPQTVSI